ncbi:MAG: FtsX-like permease family protein, partial [Treponemataceae bacterium]|nr:FtsX-like permease family protein [Treponemataceae bacterium]
ELREAPENSFNMCTINLGPKNQSKQTQVAQQVEDAIRATGNYVTSRQDAIKANSMMMTRDLNKQIDAMEVEGTIYSVYSLEDVLPALETVVSVVHTVTTIILIVIFLIVMVGISNTYRMVLYERIREIGTMRAVGLTGKNTGRLFTTEATILSLIGAFGGFVLAIVVMWIVGFFTIDNEVVAFFLHNGHISFSLDAGSVIAKYLLIMILTVFAVRGTANKASAMLPAEALRSIK